MPFCAILDHAINPLLHYAKPHTVCFEDQLFQVSLRDQNGQIDEASQWFQTCLFSDLSRTVSSKFVDTQVSSISTEEIALPRHSCCVFSRPCCNGHSLLSRSYLSRSGRIENPSCSACEHSSQDTSHLILHCPATDPLRRSLFGNSLPLYDLWSRPWKVARLLRPHGLPPCPHLSEGTGNNNNNSGFKKG